MMFALSHPLLIALIAVGVIGLIALFRLDAFEEYRRSVKVLIELLSQKGYFPEQVRNILNLYD